eukprot:1161397-Pelagomonas_calceolata.AAC.6
MADVDQEDDDRDELHQPGQIPYVLDSSAGPDQVIARIEDLVTEFVNSLASGQLMPLQLMPVPRRAAGEGGSTVSGGHKHQLNSSTCFRQLTPAVHLPRDVIIFDASVAPDGSQPDANVGAPGTAPQRPQAVHELLKNGRTATQRDLYYKLQHPPVIASSKDIDSAIQVISMLMCKNSGSAHQSTQPHPVLGTAVTRNI